jgi:DNA-binding CsgD family transcriptional regulator
MFTNRFTNEPPQQLTSQISTRSIEATLINAAPTWLQSLLNDVGFGVLILDPDLNVCFSNTDAKSALLAIGMRLLSIGSSVTEIERSHQNVACINKFLSNAKLVSKGQRKLVIFGYGDSKVALAMSPIKLDCNALDYGVMVTMERKNVCETISLWAYGKVQGLTPGELKVLQQLAEGQDPKFVAENLKISVATVRTHIRSMVNKTESSSMRNLLMKVAKLPPIRVLNGHAQE